MASSALGRLSASIILDVAEFTVGGENAKKIAAATATDIDRTFTALESKVKATMGGIGAAMAAGLGVAAMKDTFDKYAEGAAGLVDLAAKAGTTVEKLSGLGLAAKVSGTSMDELAMGLEKLSKGIVNSNTETAGAGKALAFLGVSAYDANGHLKDSATLMEEIAPKLAEYGDGIAKTTLLMDLHGKAGANLAPMYKDLAEFGVQNAKITTQQALAAKDYEQDLIRLGIAQGAVGKIVSKEVLPVADALVKTLLEMSTKTGGLRDQAKGLAEDGAIRDFAMSGVRVLGLLLNAGDSVTRMFDVVGESIGMVVARAVNLFSSAGNAIVHFIQGDYRQAWDDMKGQTQRDGEIVAAHAERVTEIFAKPLAGDSFVATVEEKLAGIDSKLNSTAESAKKSADGYKAAAAGAKMLDDAVSGLEDSLGRSIAKLQEQLTSMQKYGVMTKETSAAQVEYEITEGKVGKALADRTKYTEAGAEAIKAFVREQAAQKDGLQQSIEAWTSYVEAEKKAREEMGQIVQTTVDHIKAEKDKIATFGLSQQAITDYTIAQLEARKAQAEMTEGAEDVVRALQLQIDKLHELSGQQAIYADLKQQSQMWDQLSSKAGQFFGDLVMNGKSAFDRLRSEVRSFAQEMIALFAKRWILQMAAGAAGGGSTAAGAALGNQAESSLMSSLGGTVMTGAANYMAGGSFTAAGGAGTASIFGTGALTAGGDFVGTGLAGLAGEAALAAGATDAFALAVAEAIPVIGWIIAIGAVLYAIFGQKAGGPKAGGSFTGNFDAAGLFTGDAAASRFYTPSQADPQMATIGRSIARGYVDTVRSLGGTAAATTFGIGFDTDPNGTAPNRISSSVSVGGRSVFRSIGRDVGRDDQELQTQMKLETERMILAALQATELPAAIAAWVKTLDAATASDADIQNLLKGAAALKSLYDESDNLSAALDDTADSFRGIHAAMEALDKQVDAAKANMDAAGATGDPQAFLASEQQYRAAVLSRYQQEMQAVQALQQAIRATQESAYQFALNIAQRINSVGGSRDIGAIALGRANVLRGDVGGSLPIGDQVTSLTGYVGAIDTWYQARRQQIMSDAQAQASAANAIYQAQAGAAQARVQQLQAELAMANAMRQLADVVGKQIEAMQLSASNPASASARLGLAQEQVTNLRDQWLKASGQDRINLAQQLMGALKNEESLGQQVFDRPSAGWQAIYNSIIAQYAEIQKDATAAADTANDIQAQLLQAQRQANGYAAMSVTAEQIAASQLKSLDTEALDYYTWAEEHGRALYAQQEAANRSQLMAITGGMDAQLFIASETTKMKAIMQGIKDAIDAFLAKVAGTAPGSPGGSNTGTGPGSSGVNINVNAAAGVSPAQVLQAIKEAAPAIKRVLTTG
jgi:hypothetical protein